MRRVGLWWTALALLSTSMGWAQASADKVCEIGMIVPKQGAAKQYEEARKKHNEFHKAEKDKTPIWVWSISAGPGTGNYLTATCGQTWKEMDGQDAFEQRDEGDRQKTVTPTIATDETSYYVFREDLSNSAEGAAPAKMMTAVDYYVKPSGVVQFTEAIKRINAAIKQTNYPVKPSRWYQLAVGGEGPRFVLVTDRNSWADMQGPSQTMTDMLKQAYGNDDKTLQNLRDAIHHTVSQMFDYRADLSYLPAK